MQAFTSCTSAGSAQRGSGASQNLRETFTLEKTVCINICIIIVIIIINVIIIILFECAPPHLVGTEADGTLGFSNR